MAEDYPIKEQIVQAVVAALERISTANGYATDGVEVIRPRRTGETYAPAHHGIAVLQDEEQDAEDDHMAGNPPAIARQLPIACNLVVRQSEDSELPMDRVLNVFEADVHKALMQDVQWGGLAIDTKLRPSEYGEPSTGVEGLIVWVEITYRVSENDPYTNRV